MQSAVEEKNISLEVVGLRNRCLAPALHCDIGTHSAVPFFPFPAKMSSLKPKEGKNPSAVLIIPLYKSPFVTPSYLPMKPAQLTISPAVALLFHLAWE